MTESFHRPPLTATYRVQMHKDFPFARAQAIVAYLAQLGISHLYTSPILTARPGSTHGYDVADPTRVNPELGGDEARRALVSALHGAGLGLVVDIVPNHMGIGPSNPMWEDVLAHGERSRYASWFDIDWRSPAPGLRGKVLLPVLGDTIDKVLERGEIALVRQGDAVRVKYFDNSFPADPKTTASLPDDLEAWAAGDEGRERLLALLGRQHWRLAFWKQAAKALNYRRFFDVNELAGIRQEDPAVFDATHARILEWVAERTVDGLRIDHIDGLYDPEGYLARLRDEVAARDGGRDDAERPPVFVEKILSPGETLREAWPVAGTTGYEFLNDLECLFLSGSGAARIEEAYRKAARFPAGMDFAEVAHRGKVSVLEHALATDVSRLVRQLAAAVPDAIEQAGLGRAELEAGVRAFIAALPVYRTYVDARGVHPDDQRMIERAVERAYERLDASEERTRAAVDLVARVLLRDAGEGEEALRFVQRFQQTSGPATAKGVEDTALYRYVPLASRAEVGGEPDRPLDDPPALLHRANAERAQRWPLALVTTNTHDTKRSADVRARIDVLTELPEEWIQTVTRWRRANARFRGASGRRKVPDASAEWLLYQTLVGIWPAGGAVPGAEALASLRDRVQAYMEKANREAKARTTWTEPDPTWEGAMKEFVAALLDQARSRVFLEELTAFARNVARPGMWNALSRVAVQMTAPGTPDVYQGDELWNFTLVDPDNRRPVDYDARRRLLAAVDAEAERGGEAALIRALVEEPGDGRIKLHLASRLLRLRRRLPSLFARGRYLPLDADGGRAANLFAFARELGGEVAVVVVPRLTVALSGGAAPLGEAVWGDTRVRLPEALAGCRWRHVLTGEAIVSRDAALDAAALFDASPVAVLVAEG